MLFPRRESSAFCARQGIGATPPNKALGADEAYYWATHQGAEIDLVLFKRGRRTGVECKRMDALALTPSMRIALADLKPEKLYVVYPGEKRYALTKKVEVLPLAELVNAM